MLKILCLFSFFACYSSDAVVISAVSRDQIYDADESNSCRLPSGFVEFPDVDAAYKYFKLHKSWHEAREYCVSNNGHLAVIDSVKKLAHVKEIAKPSPIGNYKAWIGIHNLLAENEWTAIDNGGRLEALSWAEGRPTNINEWRCVAANFPPHNGTANLVNVACTADSLNFICEIPISKYCAGS